MDFLIADTFTASLARLTGEEQRAVKTSAFDLQLNPAAPALQFHRLDRAHARSFRSQQNLIQTVFNIQILSVESDSLRQSPSCSEHWILTQIFTKTLKLFLEYAAPGTD